MEPTKTTLCPASKSCPDVAITNQGVTIGGDGNRVRLSHAEWYELVRLAKAFELRQEDDLIAACDEVVASAQRTDTHTYSDAKIDRLTDGVARLVDQIVSMRAITLAGFKARARALSAIYPSIASEGKIVSHSALVAALVRDLIAAS